MSFSTVSGNTTGTSTTGRSSNSRSGDGSSDDQDKKNEPGVKSSSVDARQGGLGKKGAFNAASADDLKKGDGCWNTVKTSVIAPMTTVVTVAGRMILVGISLAQLVMGILVLYIGTILTTQGSFLFDIIEDKEKAFTQGTIWILPLNATTAPGDYSEMFKTIGHITIVLGFFTTLWAGIGFAGALWGNVTFLDWYVWVCNIAVSVEISSTCYIYVNRTVGKDALRKTLKNFGGISSKDPLSKAWNVVMFSLNCCGVNNFLDFHHLEHWPPPPKSRQSFTLKTPLACCKDRPIKNMECAKTGYANSTTNNMDSGCYEVAFDIIFGNEMIIIIIFIFIFQIFNVMLAAWIKWIIKNEATAPTAPTAKI